jgi:hypothetical protein
LQNGHVNAAEQFEVGEVLQKALADDRQNPQRRVIVDDVGEIFGDAHRDARGASCLDDTWVDANIR